MPSTSISGVWTSIQIHSPTQVPEEPIIFRVPCQEHQVRWIRSGDPQVPPVALDREQIEQVLINIVKNALEAITNAGSLEISLTAVDRQVDLRILDDGCGPDPETTAQLCSPFFSTKAQGQGVGLTLAKEVLHQHGFDFALQPAPDGRTYFLLRMPLSTQ